MKYLIRDLDKGELLSRCCGQEIISVSFVFFVCWCASVCSVCMRVSMCVRETKGTAEKEGKGGKILCLSFSSL